MFRLVCSAFVPSWRALPLPFDLSGGQRLRLHLLFALADLAALRYHARVFRMLTAAEREALLVRLLAHQRPSVRNTARRWKEIALLTA